ncbi:hypothetical protein [Bifidobacterium sp.]|uniref:hypothetical protein n=1 Tax=Bifidobacterium sp. TaxID=41200 RepID=UPI0039E8A110
MTEHTIPQGQGEQSPQMTFDLIASLPNAKPGSPRMRIGHVTLPMNPNEATTNGVMAGLNGSTPPELLCMVGAALAILSHIVTEAQDGTFSKEDGIIMEHLSLRDGRAEVVDS